MSEATKGKATGAVEALSVILPAYNEEANIERVVKQVAAYLEPLGLDYEILPVNDGSKDRTGEILARLHQENPRVKPQTHVQNKGYGGALRTGWDAATKKYTFYMDGDGQFDIKDLDKLWPLTDEDVIVTGFRIERRDPLLRRLNAKLFGGWLVRVMLGVYVKDLNCAFKIIPKKVLDSINIETNSALINAEMYARAIRAGFGIREVGVHHYAREAGVQTGAHFSVILKALVDIFRLRQRIIATQPKKKDGEKKD
jgi:glycosyltransferase involved in cell wall biosynthesis